MIICYIQRWYLGYKNGKQRWTNRGLTFDPDSSLQRARTKINSTRGGPLTLTRTHVEARNFFLFLVWNNVSLCNLVWLQLATLPQSPKCQHDRLYTTTPNSRKLYITSAFKIGKLSCGETPWLNARVTYKLSALHTTRPSTLGNTEAQVSKSRNFIAPKSQMLEGRGAKLRSCQTLKFGYAIFLRPCNAHKSAGSSRVFPWISLFPNPSHHPVLLSVSHYPGDQTRASGMLSTHSVTELYPLFFKETAEKETLRG